ncbi:MAG: hypothetical protein R3F08_16485 [Dokdonella sp.]
MDDLAAGVVDQDGTPDAMAADSVVTFTTFDPGSDAAAKAISTQPADGASNVPQQRRARQLQRSGHDRSSAFALACDSTPITLSESGGAARHADPGYPAAGQCEAFTSMQAKCQHQRCRDGRFGQRSQFHGRQR